MDWDIKPYYKDPSLVSATVYPDCTPETEHTFMWALMVAPKLEYGLGPIGNRDFSVIYGPTGEAVYQWMVVYDEGVVAEGQNIDPELCKRHAELCYNALKPELERDTTK